MAKKKAKKAQKVEWASPPPSPKLVVEDVVPALPETLPSLSEPAAPESTPDDTVQPIAAPPEPKVNDPLVEVTEVEPTSEDSIAEDAKFVEQEKEAQVPIEENVEAVLIPEPATEPEPLEDQSANQPSAQIPEESTSQEAVDTSSTIELPTLSEPTSLEAEQQDTTENTVPESVELVEAEIPPSPPPSEPSESAEEPIAAPAPQPEPVETVEEPVSAPEPHPEPVETVEEPIAEPELRPDSPATIRAPSPQHSEIQPEPAEPEPKPEPTPEPVSAIYSPSPKRSQSHPALTAPEETSASSPSPVEQKASLEPEERPSEPTPRPIPATVAQVVEDDRPPAPTPPVGRIRPRHSLAFDSDDDDDLALIQPRLRGDPSRVATYPPQSSHPRSLFASRVPAEHYSPPPPQPPPPGYHPRYYPPAAPQYHHNHAYSMSQNGGYPNPGSYGPPSHGSSPYQESWGQFPPAYPPYGSPQRHDSIGSREYPMGPPSIENSSSAVEDDTGDVFSRIAQAIPDLHVLLAKYKETHGQLGVREDLLRRAGIEQQEKLRNKDEEIHHLKDKMSHMEAKHSSDASKLRLEIGNMEEQMKELREQIAETERFKKEAEETRLALDAAKASWESRCKDLEDANAHLEKTALEQRDKAQKEFDDWRSTANTRHDAEKIALAIQFDKKLKEADVIADKQRQEAAAGFVREKDELRSEHQRQQRERESNYDRVRKELETKLSTAQKDREEALIHERESREVWEAERETLAKAYEEDRDSLQRGWDEQRELLEGQHRKNKEESDKAWIELHADANRKAEEEKVRADRLTKEKDELQRNFIELKAESQREKEVIKSVAVNLESEKARLEKLMESYGDITEIKSKGDTYYSVSFAQLQRQIIDLASTHFVHLPVSPPPDDLAHIPSGLPSFLGDTMASRQLRAAYVAHTVAKMITYRVFGPFLFSLGRRYDKADSLFSSMSNHIRDKSTRKEAIWRQQTLLAAFTSSGAKQRINTAAGTVVDEIIVAIKNFADPKEEEGIKIAVKRIVKLAAETWRFARLEREMITATMPALQDEEHKFTGLEYWPAYRPEGTPIPSLVGTTAPSDEQPKLLLRLFPVIYREPKHENFRTSEDENADVGCVFHHGLALYDDAEPVVTRWEELKQAGLPPVTNPSPTAADFPPPMIPPPRNPPPPTPEVSDKESISSATPVSRNPPPPTPEMSDKASVRSVALPPSVPPIAPSESSRSVRPPLSDLSIPPYRPRSEKASIRSASIRSASIRSASPPPPPSATPTAPSEPARSLPPAMSDLSIPPYTRPIPVPIAFSSSEDAPPLPAPTESVHTSPSSRPFNTSDNPPLPAPTESVHTSLPSRPLHTSNNPLLPAPTESITSSRPRPPIPTSTISLMPDESAIIPPLFSRRTSTTAASTTTVDADPQPSAPGSRAITPPSPLFAAIDEIDALTTHRSRNPSATASRRSTPPKTSNEELRKDRGETSRRTSGYAISNRSSMEGSTRTERTDRSSNSRYMCESRSAAIKGLYPNSPMAGTPVISRTNSLRSQGRRSIGDNTNGTWDTNSMGVSANEGNADPSTNS